MDSARHYPQDSYDSNNHEERAGFLSATEKHTQDNKSRYMLWAKVFWPLVAHGILTIIIGTLMVFYIDGGSFNLTERKPSVTLANGTTVPWSHYAPLQSDITTLVSSSLAILRLITAAWLGPLIWRCAFMLMEMPGGGLRPSELQTMISYGIPVLTRKGGRVIWLILAIVLPVHVIAPVLTGSITWVPHSQLVGQPSTSTIQVPAATRGSIRWRLWNVVAQSRERVCVQAIGLLNTAWGGSPDDSSPGNAMKRVVPSASQLEVNSTLSNVTIPYFSVTKLDWVKDPANTLGLNRLFPPTDDICLKVSLVDHPLSCVNMFDNVGAFALIPDTPPVWADNATFPSPLVVSETRLMILYVSSARRIGMTSYEPCQSLPNLIPYPPTSNTGCWAFARVTYTAGASACTNCRVSSRSTVQSDEALSVLGDPLTGLALRMMPTVISTMVALNTTTFSSEINPDDYIIKHLSRSYAASWNALTHHLSQTLPFLNTTYSAAIPSSRATVSLPRVYLWLGIQLLVTISGTIFVWVQAKSTDELITDTTLVAFYLDSGDVSADHSELREGPLRKLEYGEGHLKVKVV